MYGTSGITMSVCVCVCAWFHLAPFFSLAGLAAQLNELVLVCIFLYSLLSVV